MWTTIIQNSIDALSLGSLFALLALGIALIFGIMKLVNFAHGELIMVGGYTLFFLTGDWIVVVLMTVLMTAFFALAMDRLAFRPIRAPGPGTLLVASFAVAFLLQNVAILVMGARPRSVGLWPVLSEFFVVGGLRIPRLHVITVVATLAILVGLGTFLQRTTVGIQMRAAAENFSVARLLGVRANRVVAAAFAMSGLLAGVAAILFVAQTGTVSPRMGLYPVLVAFIATIMGGLGNLRGAVLGGFLLGIITVIFQALLPLSFRPYRDAFVFGIVLLILLARPHGLLLAEATRGGR